MIKAIVSIIISLPISPLMIEMIRALYSIVILIESEIWNNGMRCMSFYALMVRISCYGHIDEAHK